MAIVQLALTPIGQWLHRAVSGAGPCKGDKARSPVRAEVRPPLRPRRWLGRARDWSDDELVARLCSSDVEASGEFARRFSPLVRYLCAGRAAGHMEAADLEQEVWAYLAANNWEPVRVWEHRCPLSAYLSVIATRTVREVARKARAENERTVPLGNAVEASDENGLPFEDRTAVRLCMGKLPDSQRLAISLRFFDALSHKEIAGLLGISVAASRKRVFDGVRALERMLSEAYPHLSTAEGASP